MEEVMEDYYNDEEYYFIRQMEEEAGLNYYLNQAIQEEIW